MLFCIPISKINLIIFYYEKHLPNKFKHKLVTTVLHVTSGCFFMLVPYLYIFYNCTQTYLYFYFLNYIS